MPGGLSLIKALEHSHKHLKTSKSIVETLNMMVLRFLEVLYDPCFSAILA
jgi:hypothetical protein